MANYFPTTLSDFQTYISGLINDPSNTRYPLLLINSQLDLAQHRWNAEAKICRYTDWILAIANQYRYQISNFFSVNPIQLLRVTWKGVPLVIRSKDYFDKYSQIDWTTTTGTPQECCIDLNTLPNVVGPIASFILHPTPTANDVVPYSNAVGISNQNPLAIEYVCPHTQMVNPTDQPFTSNFTWFNQLIIPYLAGLGLDVAASLLEPDPTPETVQKAKIFRSQANGYLSLVVQMYQGLEEDVPARFSGGRTIRPAGIA
jgi:hypothetical protein